MKRLIERFLPYSVFLLFWVLIQPAIAQKPKSQMAVNTRILFVLDASGSMRADWEGQPRIAIAKKVLSDLVDSLNANSKVQLGLRVYGHQTDYKQNDCKDSKLEVPFTRGNNAGLITSLNAIIPKGTTPLAYSMEKATGDFPSTKGSTRNVVIMITDGKEECKGDPCAISKKMQEKGVFLRPFVVGLGIPPQYEKDFSCMGKYYNAKDVSQFKGFLKDIINQTLGKTTVSVELLDKSGAKVEKDVNVSFINRVSGKGIYDYVIYRDAQKKTDKLKVDAIMTYDIVANTLPPVVKKNVNFKGGIHNEVKIKVPRGSLGFNFSGFTQYTPEFTARVVKSSNKELVNHQKIKLAEFYIEGKYDIEIPTVPVTVFKKVKIKAGEKKVLKVASPGVLNIGNPTRLKGFGSVYKLDRKGYPTWVKNFEGMDAKQNITLQPGKYKVVFRATEAYGSEYTIVKKISVTSGASATISLIN